MEEKVTHDAAGNAAAWEMLSALRRLLSIKGHVPGEQDALIEALTARVDLYTRALVTAPGHAGTPPPDGAARGAASVYAGPLETEDQAARPPPRGSHRSARELVTA